MSETVEKTEALEHARKQETALTKRGLDRDSFRVLCETVWPGAKERSVMLAIDYCRARKLDPFKRPVHIVPVYSKAAGGMVDTIWPGISEIRTTAMRTSAYAGRDATAFGQNVKQKIGETQMEFPEWAQITVYRFVQKERCPFPGPKTYWRETYAHYSRTDKKPNSMWEGRPFGQLEKCAEAAALRAAFPEELGNQYAAEEMEGKDLSPHNSTDVDFQVIPKEDDAPSDLEDEIASEIDDDPAPKDTTLSQLEIDSEEKPKIKRGRPKKNEKEGDLPPEATPEAPVDLLGDKSDPRVQSLADEMAISKTMDELNTFAVIAKGFSEDDPEKAKCREIYGIMKNKLSVPQENLI